MINKQEDTTCSREIINNYKDLLKDLKVCYSRRSSQRNLMTSTNPQWRDIEQAQALAMMQMATFTPTSPDYYEAHDCDFGGLSR